MSRDPVRILLDANLRFRGRYDEPLRRKIERMASSSLEFLRGSMCLFARDVLDRKAGLDPEMGGLLPVEGPIVGDLHCENFGTFKAEDGAVRFDLNDFDEATRGNLALDAVRGAASLLLLAWERGAGNPAALQVAEAFARAWAGGLSGGSRTGLPVAGAVRRILRRVEKVKRTRFIEGVTRLKGGRRTIVRNDHLFDLRPVHRGQALRLLADYRRRVKGGDFFAAEDVCGRIAGCGSLGKLRYAVLVQGEGSREAKNIVLEFKEAIPPSYPGKKGGGRGRAEAIAGLQRAMQVSTDRHFGIAVDGEASFLVHEIGPRNERLHWGEVRGEPEMADVAALQGALLARGQRRANGDRSSLAKAVRGRVDDIVRRLLGLALGYAAQVLEDHACFLRARPRLRRELLG